MSEQNQIPPDQIPPDGGSFTPPPNFESLEQKDGLATLSWYLVATGIIALVFAAICLYLDRTGARDFFFHGDFALNPNALGRLLLLVGITFYILGRAITYYRRFRKRSTA